MEDYKVIFESKNILYINLSESLVNEYLELINDADVQDLYLLEPGDSFSVEDEKTWVKEKLNNHDPIFSMIDKRTKEYIGNIEVIVDGNIGELTIAITQKMQNKKYGSEAIERIIDYAYNDLKLEKIKLGVFTKNKRAIHVYEKFGFVVDYYKDDYMYMIHKGLEKRK